MNQLSKLICNKLCDAIIIKEFRKGNKVLLGLPAAQKVYFVQGSNQTKLSFRHAIAYGLAAKACGMMDSLRTYVRVEEIQEDNQKPSGKRTERLIAEVLDELGV